jgi:ATP-dependent DNA helicase 2 subunit 2
MSRTKEIEGLVLLLDVGSSMSTKLPNSSTSYLQACADTIQMIVQRKMFQTSKDELALVLFGTNETANVLWDGESDHYRHVSVARQLAVTDWKLLEYVQNKLAATNLDGDVLDGLVVASNHFHEDANRLKFFKDKRIIIFTDFSSNVGNDDELKSISSGFHSI